MLSPFKACCRQVLPHLHPPAVIVRFLLQIKWFKTANYLKNGCNEPH